jgi:hypothetical protein
MRSLALRAVGAHAADAALDEASPHASVDSGGIRTLHDERPQRARRALQDRRVSLERLHRDLETERSERIADALEAGTNVSRLLQAGCGSQAASEVLARFSEGSLPAAGRNPADQKADELRQPPVGELDAFQLGRDTVDVCRTPGTGSTPTALTFGRDHEESGPRQSVEPVACDIAVNAERQRDFVRGKRIVPRARVEKDPAKLGIAGRCEAVERHSGEKLPVGRACELSRRATRPRGEHRRIR